MGLLHEFLNKGHTPKYVHDCEVGVRYIELIIVSLLTA